MLKWIVALSLLNLVACTNEVEEKKPDLMVKVEELGEDVLIPTKIWDYAWEGAGDFSFSEVKVDLIEKFPGVLKKSHIQIQLPAGGGQIDLADYLTDKTGTFFLSFRNAGDQDLEQESMFFVSRYPQIVSFGETIGSGCHKLLVLNSAFKNEVQTKGLEVNTTNARHLALIGGTFVLLKKVDGQNQMAQVTFFDSRFTDKSCAKGEE